METRHSQYKHPHSDGFIYEYQVLQTKYKQTLLTHFNPRFAKITQFLLPNKSRKGLYIKTPNGKPFSIARTSLTTKYRIVTDWSSSPNKVKINSLNSSAIL